MSQLLADVNNVQSSVGTFTFITSCNLYVVILLAFHKLIAFYPMQLFLRLKVTLKCDNSLYAITVPAR